jgi:hypothetical protein
MMHQQMHAPQFGRYAEQDMNANVGSYANTMEVDEWSTLEAGSAYEEGIAGPSGTGDPSGNQWNVGRTLRGVFHFGRNPQENIYQRYPPQAPPSEGTYHRH